MLTRTQFRALLAEAREIADGVERRLCDAAELQAQRSAAFSRGEPDRLKTIRRSLEDVEDAIQSDRERLRDRFARIRDVGSQYRDTLVGESGGVPSPDAIPALPGNEEPERIEDYRAYFGTIEVLVDDLVGRLTRVRQEATAGDRATLEALLDEAVALGRPLDGVRQSLHDEAFLDMPLDSLLQWLGNSIVLARDHLAAVRAEQEAQRRRTRREEIRRALERLVREGRKSGASPDGLLAEALDLERDGAWEEHDVLSRALDTALRTQGPDALQQVLARLADQVQAWLAAEEEALPGVLERLDASAREALDSDLAGDNRLRARLVECAEQALSSGDGTGIALLLRLKKSFPVVAHRLARGLEERLTVEHLAAFLARDPQEPPGDRVLEGALGRRLEKAGRWPEAGACRRLADDAEGVRRNACLWVALAEDEGLMPTSVDDWWGLLTRSPGLSDDPLLAAVAVAASLKLSGRFRLPVEEVFHAARPVLRDRPSLLAAMERAVDFQSWCASQGRDEALRLFERREELQRRLRDTVEGERSPAGGPARDFWRHEMQPQLGRLWRGGGLEALADLDDDIVRRMLERRDKRIPNPVAVHTMEEWICELAEIARELSDLDPVLKSLPDDAARRALMQGMDREERARGGEDPLWHWAAEAVGGALGVVAPPGRADRRTFSGDDVPAILFPDHPWIRQAGWPAGNAPEGRIEVLEGIAAGPDVDAWRVRRAIRLEAFPLASAWVSRLPDGVRADLEGQLRAALESARLSRRERIELLGAYAGMLGAGEDLALLSDELASVSEAVDRGDLAQADRRLADLESWVEDVERKQQQASAERLERGSGLMSRILPALAGQADERASRVLAAARELMDAFLGKDARRIETLLEAVEAILEGRQTDWRPSAAARVEAAPALVKATREEDLDAAPAAPALLPATIHEPVRLEELPRLVRIRLEDLLGNPPAEGSARGGAAGEGSPGSMVDALRAAWAVRKGWEAPLVEWLGHLAAGMLREHRYVMAAEFYLAQAQVAWRASSRLDRGTYPSRLAALNHAFCRLRMLRGEGDGKAPAEPFLVVSSRLWVGLYRDFGLQRGIPDLADVVTALLKAVPDQAEEFLEIPLAELQPLRPPLLRALLERQRGARNDEHEALRSVAVIGLTGQSRASAVTWLDRLKDAAVRRAGGKGAASQALERSLEELEQSLPGCGLDDVAREACSDALKRLRGGADPRGEGSPEATFSAMTRELFRDSFVEGAQVPVHVRLNLKAGSPTLRQVSVSLRCQDPDIEVVPACNTLEVNRLVPEEPVDLACALRLRPGLAAVAMGPRELTMEITALGLREEGLVKANVPYKGHNLKISLQRDYPFQERLCPYSPGPAVKDMHLIKGRSQEVRQIFQTLRGAHQDNVPLVWGPRRIGKSTLLYRFALDPEVQRHYVPLLCDMEGLIRGRDSSKRFLARVARRLSETAVGSALGRVSVPAIHEAPDGVDAFQAYIDGLVAACGNQRTLLLMFDELDLFFDASRSASEGDGDLHEDFVRFLRHNMQHNPRVSFMMCGTRRLLELTGRVGERLFQLPVSIEIGVLDPADATELLTEPVKDIYSWSTLARERLLFLTSCHPYLLQAVGFELFEFMKSRRLSVCTRAELDQVLEDKVLKQSQYFQFQVTPLRQDPARMRVARAVAELTEEERRTDVDTVRAHIELSTDRPAKPEEVETLLASLVEEGTLMNWRKEFRFRLPLVGLYVARLKNTEVQP